MLWSFAEPPAIENLVLGGMFWLQMLHQVICVATRSFNRFTAAISFCNIISFTGFKKSQTLLRFF
jgi:hypothetical protein